jgi:hypothetical protein
MRPLAVVLALLALALAGASCSGSKPFGPTGPQYADRIPEIVAVAAPDSVAAGNPFDVELIWAAAEREELSRVDLATRADTLCLTPVVRRELGQTPAAQIGTQYGTHPGIPTDGMPRGALHLEILHAGPPIVLPVQIGDAPAPVRRFALRLEDRGTGQPIAGAEVEVVGWRTVEGYELARAATDADGKLEFTRPCDAIRFPQLSVEMTSLEYAKPNWVYTYEVRCGEPESMVFRVHASGAARASRATTPRPLSHSAR